MAACDNNPAVSAIDVRAHLRRLVRVFGIGVAQGPHAGGLSELELLLAQAEGALHRAKEQGGTRWPGPASGAARSTA